MSNLPSFEMLITPSVGCLSANIGLLSTISPHSRGLFRFLGTAIPSPYHLVHSKQVRQREQHRQLVIVLPESFVPCFHKTKLTFDESEWVFHLGADAGFELLKDNHRLVFTRMFFKFLELARAHGYRPFSLHIGQLFTVFCPLYPASANTNSSLPWSRLPT